MKLKYSKAAKILFCLFLIFSQSAIAGGQLPAQQISGIGTGWSGEGIYINFKDGVIIEGCAQNRVLINTGNPLLSHIVAIALSAYHAKKLVRIRVEGCAGPVMNGVAISISD